MQGDCSIYQQARKARDLTREEEVTLPRSAVVCAARNYVAAHESAVSGVPVDFGSPCRACEYLDSCQGDWIKMAAPVFEAAKVFPQVYREV